MKSGDVLGHENMGEVVEVGSENKKLKVGDRVVVPFTIACGECFFCKHGFYSGCERTNPDHEKAAKLWGNSPAGLFGYSHLLGGYAGGQAEYLRVPYADVGPIKVPDSLSDEQVLFLSDIFPTGYMAADSATSKAAKRLPSGAAGRSASSPSAAPSCSARSASSPSTPCRSAWRSRAPPAPRRSISWRRMSTTRIMEMTQGRGADACIDAVGTEAEPRPVSIRGVDRIKVATFMGTDRPHVLRQAIHCCRNFGVVSIVGVYGGFLDKIPMGSAINRGLTFRMAQTPVQHYLPKLLDAIEEGEIDPSFVITHVAPLEQGPGALQDVPRQEGRLHQGGAQARHDRNHRS